MKEIFIVLFISGCAAQAANTYDSSAYYSQPSLIKVDGVKDSQAQSKPITYDNQAAPINVDNIQDRQTPYTPLLPTPKVKVGKTTKGVQGSLITMTVGLGLTALSAIDALLCRGCPVSVGLFITASPVVIFSAIAAFISACINQ